jgi:lincosamide nucleotidyltransferase A/C/D/E
VTVLSAAEALRVLEALSSAGLGVWLDGGWGVDALLGQETRQHGDVDLVVELGAMPAVFEALGTLGYAVHEDLAPVRVVLRSVDGRQADLHPVTFDQDGTGWQSGASADGSDCPYPPLGFGTGRILGQPVPCLSPELQVEHHRGYAPREHDRADMANLAERFGLSLPDPYR